jgi:hypothetical protein
MLSSTRVVKSRLSKADSGRSNLSWCHITQRFIILRTLYHLGNIRCLDRLDYMLWQHRRSWPVGFCFEIQQHRSWPIAIYFRQHQRSWLVEFDYILQLICSIGQRGVIFYPSNAGLFMYILDIVKRIFNCQILVNIRNVCIYVCACVSVFKPMTIKCRACIECPMAAIWSLYTNRRISVCVQYVLMSISISQID